MSQQAQRLYRFGPYLLNPAQQLLAHGDEKIQLTPKAFQTLLALVEAHGQIVGKEELLQKIWPGTFVEEATLAQNVFTIRRLLQDDREKAVYIETVPKRGYRFAAKVLVEEPDFESRRNDGIPIGAAERDHKWTWRLAAEVAIIVLATAALWRYWIGVRKPAPTARGTTRVVMAVLPVANLTGDADEEYLTDGLTEELIADLGGANPQQMAVIARTSAMVYKQTNKNVHEIARELAADYVLESSLRESSGHVRFTAQLIRTQDQTHVWAQNYDRAKTDVLALQGELAKTVSEQVRIELSPQAAARLATHRDVQPAAYDAYLKGRFFWNKRTPSAMTNAEDYFQKAIQEDPNFAPAYAGLADCYQIMVNLEQIKASEGYARARAAAVKALQLDPSSAEAHTSLASIKGDFDWDWAGSESEYKRALELNPNYATAHHWYAEFLGGVGRIDEAIHELENALELDPLSPVISVSLGQMECRAGHCQQGIEQITKTLNMYPDFGEAHEGLAIVYAKLGMYDAAIAEYKQTEQSPEGHSDFLLGYAAAKAGRRQDALRFLQHIETTPGFHHKDYFAGLLYAALGDQDRAFASFESARQSHDVFLAYLQGQFVVENIRLDPRYGQLLDRMKMPH